MNIRIKPSRRDMLKGGGALIVGFSFVSSMSEALAQGTPAGKPLELTEVDSYLAIDVKGGVTLYSGKVDLGTGVETAPRRQERRPQGRRWRRSRWQQAHHIWSANRGQELLHHP